MATESSAVVRFIDLAQRAHNPVRPTAPLPPPPVTSDFGTEIVREVRRPRSSRAPLVVGAMVLAGGAAAGGVYFGKNGFGGSDGPGKSDAPAAAAAVTAPVAAERVETAPAAAPPTQAAEPTPQVTSPVVTVPAEVLAATGFDIRVEPGATITLDGSVLGKAPLRVRNLQPGAHVVDIEAPAGFFSRRVELALGAGEAKELRVALDPIQDDGAAAIASDDKPKAKRSRSDLRRERREKAREEAERKKEMRATRAAAAKAAKADKRAKKSAPVVAEPLPEESKAPAKEDAKMSAADAELDAAMAEIVGKPAPRRSAASAAGASSLSSSSGASAGDGTLMLGSKPPCDIIVDGKPTGLKTPQRAMALSAGTHRVILVNKELGIEKKFKVKIAPGKTTKAIQDLTSAL